MTLINLTPEELISVRSSDILTIVRDKNRYIMSTFWLEFIEDCANEILENVKKMKKEIK